jgi:hypothetical protein
VEAKARSKARVRGELPPSQASPPTFRKQAGTKRGRARARSASIDDVRASVDNTHARADYSSDEDEVQRLPVKRARVAHASVLDRASVTTRLGDEFECDEAASACDDAARDEEGAAEDASVSEPLPMSEAERLHALLRGLKGKPDRSENNLDTATLKEMLLVLRTMWLAPLNTEHGGWTPAAVAAIDRLELHGKMHGDFSSNNFNLSIKDITEAYTGVIFQLVRLQFCFRQRGIIEPAPSAMPGSGSGGSGARKRNGVEDVGGNSYSAMFGQLMSVAAHFKDALVSEMRLRRALDSSVNAADPTPADPWRFVPMDLTNLSPRQGFFLFILNELQAMGFRRYNKACYEQIMSPPKEVQEEVMGDDGVVRTVTRMRIYPTRAWRRVCDIGDFIRNVARKEEKWEQWKNMMLPGCHEATVRELESCNDVEFAELQPDRHWFAYRDGLLCTHTSTFYTWDDPCIPADVVACRYIDADLNIMIGDCSIFEVDSWYDIETPAIQSVLEYQLEHLQWEEGDVDRKGEPNPFKMHEVIMIFYLFFGRLLFEVGEKDAWQVLLFVVGRAGTGKCVSPDTMVLLHDGRVKAAKDVVRGDKLMGDDSTPRTVLTTTKGTDAMFRVVPSKGRPFECNGPHVLTLKGAEPFIVHRPTKGLPYAARFTEQGRVHTKSFATEVEASEFIATLPEDVFDMPLEKYMALPAQQQRYCHLYHAAVDYPAQPVPFDPYMIGYWLGDGTSEQSDITIADPEVVAYFERALPALGLAIGRKAPSAPLEYRISGSGDNYRKVGGNTMLNALRECDILNNKHIPLVYSANSRTVRMELLAGILDSDGHLAKDGCFEVIQQNERLARDIERLALSLGFMASMTPCLEACVYKGERREGTYYRVTIYGEGLDAIPTHIPRKRAAPRQLVRRSTCQRFTVEPLGEGPYAGWQLDGNARFLLADHTVTHNSTILDTLADFFQPEDVEVLANKGRKGDGELQTFINKFLWMCREVKNDLTLDQAQLQSMITGETMSISVLYGTNMTVTWKVPGVMAGNEAANWTDNSGSISRRIVTAYFERKVNPSVSDPHLKHKIRAQMPQFIYKCCVAYLSAVREFGDKDIWGTMLTTGPGGVQVRRSILPEYFHNSKKRLQALTHPLENFLRTSDNLTLLPSGSVGADVGMPWERFKDLANLWMERNNIRGFQWKEDKFRNVLEENDIRRRKLTVATEYQGKLYKASTYWVYGVSEGNAIDSAVGEVAAAAHADVHAPTEDAHADAHTEDADGAHSAGHKRKRRATPTNEGRGKRRVTDNEDF